MHKPSGKRNDCFWRKQRCSSSKITLCIIAEWGSLRGFYHNVLKSTSGLTDEPVPQDTEKNWWRSHAIPKDRYREAYFEAIDHASGEIEKQFDQSDLAVVHEVESLLVDAANSEDVPEIPEVVARYFQGKIDIAHLKIQLLMLPDACLCWFFHQGEGDERQDHCWCTQPEQDYYAHACWGRQAAPSIVEAR